MVKAQENCPANRWKDRTQLAQGRALGEKGRIGPLRVGVRAAGKALRLLPARSVCGARDEQGAGLAGHALGELSVSILWLRRRSYLEPAV